MSRVIPPRGNEQTITRREINKIISWHFFGGGEGEMGRSRRGRGRGAFSRGKEHSDSTGDDLKNFYFKLCVVVT